MQLTPSLDVAPWLEEVAHQAYQSIQWGKQYFSVAHKTISSRIFNTIFPPEPGRVQPLPNELLEWIQDRYEAILQADWDDAQAGVYPLSLLFENPWPDLVKYYPLVWLDLPQLWQRGYERRFQDFPDTIPLEQYPQYYRQNFHYQTDGYLSDKSANLYDLQVEILFGGTADPMRRRVLAPLKSGLQAWQLPEAQLKILDVACGTGRMLKQLRAAFPQASLHGTDLSPAYLRKANELLAERPGELPQLLQANAESLPYTDNYFHGLTCIFLFHELPAPVRQTIINECFRVLQPGGTLVFCDSIQLIDAPDKLPMMENFVSLFHEPFYRNYIQDDLVERLEKAGFSNVEVSSHFMSKYWRATKPV